MNISDSQKEAMIKATHETIKEVRSAKSAEEKSKSLKELDEKIDNIAKG